MTKQRARWVLRALVPAVVAWWAVPAFAGEPPGWSRGQQLLPISYEECVKRAPLALQAEGYRIDHAAGAFAVGIRDIHTAVIMCNPAPESKTWVNIVVASNGEGGGATREKLQTQMTRAAPVAEGGGGAAPTPATAGRYLQVSVDGRRAILDWANAPTGGYAWVSIVPAGTRDDTHVGMWLYTQGKPSGRYEKDKLEPGPYEARFYGDSGYSQILDRVRFEVR